LGDPALQKRIFSELGNNLLSQLDNASSFPTNANNQIINSDWQPIFKDSLNHILKLFSDDTLPDLPQI
jgi:hypothetical protein